MPCWSRTPPAFVVNRLLLRMMGEVFAAVDEGTPIPVADAALKPLGLPMSPMVLLQLVGPPIVLHVLESLHAAFPDRFAVSRNLQALVEAGRTGIYDWTPDGETYVSEETEALLSVGDQPSTAEQVLDRATSALAEEIGLMLDEGVVEAPMDIDLCLILGAGWPFHLGGITPYLDRTGVSERVLGRPHSAGRSGYALRDRLHMLVCDTFVCMALDRLSITVDAELGRAVREAAAADGMSVSSWAGEALAQRVRKLPAGSARCLAGRGRQPSPRRRGLKPTGSWMRPGAKPLAERKPSDWPVDGGRSSWMPAHWWQSSANVVGGRHPAGRTRHSSGGVVTSAAVWSAAGLAGRVPAGQPGPDASGLRHSALECQLAGRRIGELLAVTRTSDVVDAHIALLDSQ